MIEYPLLRAVLSSVFVASCFFTVSCLRAEADDSTKPSTLLREMQQPVLNWEPRSDWKSVKDFGAVGDGIADDTAAIQSLFDELMEGKGKVAYFPPGQYRITQTLTMGNDLAGIYVVGHGRDSVLIWDGEEGGSMYLSNGVHRSRFEGLAFDGRGKAGICIEHTSQTRYETNLTYANCAFLNADYGIAVSKNPRELATAEVFYRNNLFKNLGTAILLNYFNDYDHLITGCLFVDNERGLVSTRGHFHLHNCNFIGSRDTDVRVTKPQHPSSIRWCTSEGSRQFLDIGVEGDDHSHQDWVQAFTVQDCLVKGWSNPEGAVFLKRLGPLFLFDTRFVDPPSDAAPVQIAKKSTVFLLSGNTPEAAGDLLSNSEDSVVYEIPKGGVAATVSEGPTRGFFAEEVDVSGRVFDARRDFGAVGDGEADDTSAVQATIDAARENGDRAIAYLPTGVYRITSPLRVGGSNYQILGNGYSTNLQYAGGIEDAVLEVHDPDHLAIEHLMISSRNDGPTYQGDPAYHGKQQTIEEFFDRKTDEDRRLSALGNVKVRQTGSGKPSSIFYNGVYLFNPFGDVPGIQLVDLPTQSTVRVGANLGSITLMDSGQATVVVQAQLGRVVVEGAKLPKTGLAGFLFLNDAHRNFAVTIRDNQDLVVADFYQEQNERHALIEGGDREGDGYVTMGLSKLGAIYPGFVKVDNYEGRIWINGGGIMAAQAGSSFDKNPVFLEHDGDRPVDFILAGATFRIPNPPPIFQSGSSMRLTTVGNFTTYGEDPVLLPDKTAEGWKKTASKALDDFRRLGATNIQLNFPAPKP